MSEVRAKLAACVALVDDQDRVFLARRTNTDWANGMLGIPGGIVEHGESAEAAACREMLEEVGVLIQEKDLEFNECVHFIQDNHDVITFHFACRQWSGEAKNNEPEKISEAGWFKLNALPDDIIPHSYAVLESIDNPKALYASIDMRNK